MKKDNNWKKRIITLLIFVLGWVLFGLNNNVYAEEVSNFSDLKNNLEKGISVILEKDIEVTEPVVIKENSDVTIDFNGHNLKCSQSASNVGGSNGAMIKVTNKGTSLSIINNGSESGFINDNNSDCRAIYVSSAVSLSITDIKIQNVKFENFTVSKEKRFGGAIYYKGSYNNLEITDSKFINNESSNGGAIYFDSVASSGGITIKNTTFKENKTICTTAGQYGQYNGAGGAIYFGYGYENVLLEDNTFDGNRAIQNVPDPEPLPGGYVYYGPYASGGAIYINRVNGLDLINNKFINNTSSKDGGAIIIYVDSTAKPVEISGKGTLFDKNTAERGGAIFIYQSSVDTYDTALELKEGTFSNNHASDDGGAINYTQGGKGSLKLTNALITGNKAVVGGGIWLCPTGLLQTYSTLGGAIYGNTATGSFVRNGNIYVDARGNEIRYSVENADDALSDGASHATNYVTISPRNHEGKIIDWYADEVAHRYQSGDSPVNILDYKKRTTEFSLTRADDDYFEDADVIFINNTADKRGGAIATNYTLIIGEPEDMDITVNKSFVKDGQPYNDPNKMADNLKIYINLYRIDANGERILLDKNVELNKGNNFTYTFTDLPTKYNDEEGNLQTYSYEVKEVDEKNQVSNTCTSLNSTTTCTITNEYVAPPVEFVPSVEKKVTGKTKPKKDETFTFEISSKEKDGVELPKNTKVKVKGEGRVNFGNIKITKAGEYNFTIKEVLGNNLDYKYDSSVWMVKVVVGENVEKGTLYIDSIKYYKKNKEYEEVVFENEYNPSTGDPLLSNVSNFIISGFVILGISIIKRKIYN